MGPESSDSVVAEPETDALSRIIRDLNERHGLQLGAGDEIVRRIAESLVDDPDLKEAAAANSFANFELLFDEKFEEKALEARNQSWEFFERAFGDAEIRDQLEDALARAVYAQLTGERRWKDRLTKPARESILARHHPVGVSTGYMEGLRSDWPAQVAEAATVSVFAVELSALSEKELEPLQSFLSSTPSLPFRYLSVHGPSKDREIEEDRLVAALRDLARWSDAIVMHPDTLAEPSRYQALGRKLLLENMDSRKQSGRTYDELETAFAELPDAGFCFDIAHAWSVDPEMRVARDLLDGFSDRLRHVHLSSLSSELHHVPLTKEDEELFRPLLERCVDVPWILEAPPRTD